MNYYPDGRMSTRTRRELWNDQPAINNLEVDHDSVESEPCDLLDEEDHQENDHAS